MQKYKYGWKWATAQANLAMKNWFLYGQLDYQEIFNN